MTFHQAKTTAHGVLPRGHLTLQTLKKREFSCDRSSPYALARLFPRLATACLGCLAHKTKCIGMEKTKRRQTCLLSLIHVFCAPCQLIPRAIAIYRKRRSHRVYPVFRLQAQVTVYGTPNRVAQERPLSLSGTLGPNCPYDKRKYWNHPCATRSLPKIRSA